MIDWSLARQIARFAASRGPTERIDADMGALSGEAVRHVTEYTGLAVAAELPPAELVDRPDWAEANLATLSEMLDPVGERMLGRLGSTGPFAGPLRIAAGATMAAEAGLVVGYMSQRVLGQFELSLLAPEAKPRLLYVEPNLANAVRVMRVEADSFLGWVALHEVTHVLQFTAVPWLRRHLGDLMREYLATVDVRIERGAAGGLPSLPDPAAMVRNFREGGLMALVQTHEQRRIMDQVQATMAVVEGYSEHVMDAVGESVLDSYAGLREAMEERRRSRSTPERILQRLLGFDQKMRQYEIGKRFCDAVVTTRDIETLNRVWTSPSALPGLGELRRPEAWLKRVDALSAAA